MRLLGGTLIVKCGNGHVFYVAKNSSIDDRAFMMFLMNAMGARDTNNMLYPRIYPLVRFLVTHLPNPL